MHWRTRHRPLTPPEAQIRSIVRSNVTLARSWSGESFDHLISVTAGLIEAKHWEATGGLDLSPEIIVTIAGNAAIPIAGLDDWLYRHVSWIIVHPSTTISHGTRSGPAPGVVSDSHLPVVGMASPNSGPVSISWDAVLTESRHPDAGRNVVIHEFAHKIDMSDGYSDGLPPVRGAELDRWTEIIGDEYDRPDTRDSDSVLRPYAWTSPAEFFAVSTEVFFSRPDELQRNKPVLYRALADFYHQDPANKR